MSLNANSIFQPRRLDTADTTITDSLSNDTVNDTNTYGTELTKTKNYCATRLPAFPSALNAVESNLILNGYAENITKHALVVSEGGVLVWKYDSTDSSPLSIQFPLDASPTYLPLAILTTPSNGTLEPGLAILTSSNGIVRFYENIQHAPALGLINDKSLEMSIPLNFAKGEYITLAENVEPCGIVYATSWKRCVLISLRNSKGKPSLSYIQLLAPSISTSIMSYFLGSEKIESSSNPENEIVSIRAGTLNKNNFTQEIIVQETSGRFNLFTCGFPSTHSKLDIQKASSFSVNLCPYLYNNIDGYLPGSNLDLQFLDIWPLVSSKGPIYLGLCIVNNLNSSQKSLILISLKIEQSGVLSYGTHRLLRGKLDADLKFKIKPKLFLPAPGNTAIVIVDNTIVLTDVDTSYIDSDNMSQYYKPRWEDLIRLKSSVDIIGFGFEHRKKEVNPGLIVLTSNYGILRIERFLTKLNDDSEVNLSLQSQLYEAVKSHIEQGVFFDDSTAIDFDVMDMLPSDNAALAVEDVVSDIVNSNSAYLPDFMHSVLELLKLKDNLLRRLLYFIRRNYKDSWKSTLPKITEIIEKIEVAYNLWDFINESTNKAVFISKLTESVQALSSEDQKLVDVRDFFTKKVACMDIVMSSFLEKCIGANISSQELSTLIVKSAYNGVLKVEAEFIVGTDIEPYKLWVFNSSLIVQFEDIYTRAYCTSDSIIDSVDFKADIIEFCELLHYLINNALQFMSTRYDYRDQMKEYNEWYRNRSEEWINALLKRGLYTQAIEIVERYSCFRSLAHILHFEKERILNESKDVKFDLEQLSQRYTYYFDRYGYGFAEKLFEYHIDHNRPSQLFTDFEDYQQYLKQYFDENAEKCKEISWIQDINDGRFLSASRSLILSAAENDLNNRHSQKLKYSLAKLSFLEHTTEMKNSNNSQDVIQTCNDNLHIIRVVDNLLNVFKTKAELSSDRVLLESFITRFAYSKESLDIIQPTISPLVAGKPLSIRDIIQLLTLVKPNMSYQTIYADAMSLSKFIDDTESRIYLIRLIWLRLLTISDDWDELSATENKSDKYAKKKIHHSFIFQTIHACHENEILYKELKFILTESGIPLQDKFATEAEIKLNNSLFHKLQDLRENANIEQWINSICDESAKQGSFN